MKRPARPSLKTLVILAIGLGLVVWIGWAAVAKYREMVDPETARPVAPIPVRVELLTAQPFSVQRAWRGSIDVDERATLSAQLTAAVLDLPYREGQRVASGELVYRLDDAELQAERAMLVAVIDGADGELGTARRELERQQELFARGLTPQKLLDEAAQRVDSLVAHKREAEANLELVATRLAYAKGRAPFAGTVQRLHVQRGELARAGSPILDLVADDTLTAVVCVAQADIGHVGHGLPVSVQIPALNQYWAGQIDRVYPVLDEATRNATVAVVLPADAAGARVGMTAIVHARIVDRENALTVPTQAVSSTHGASWVFVPEGDQARRRPVQTGPDEGGRTLIEAGLKVGERIIVTADPRLADGVRISIENGRAAP